MSYKVADRSGFEFVQCEDSEDVYHIDDIKSAMEWVKSCECKCAQFSEKAFFAFFGLLLENFEETKDDLFLVISRIDIKMNPWVANEIIVQSLLSLIDVLRDQRDSLFGFLSNVIIEYPNQIDIVGKYFSVLVKYLDLSHLTHLNFLHTCLYYLRTDCLCDCSHLVRHLVGLLLNLDMDIRENAIDCLLILVDDPANMKVINPVHIFSIIQLSLRSANPSCFAELLLLLAKITHWNIPKDFISDEVISRLHFVVPYCDSFHLQRLFEFLEFACDISPELIINSCLIELLLVTSRDAPYAVAKCISFFLVNHLHQMIDPGMVMSSLSLIFLFIADYTESDLMRAMDLISNIFDRHRSESHALALSESFFDTLIELTRRDDCIGERAQVFLEEHYWPYYTG